MTAPNRNQSWQHLAAAVLAVTASGWAMGSPDTTPQLEVTVEVLQERILMDADGHTQVQQTPVQTATPGDVLIYTLRANNTGDVPAHTARLQDPIPEGTVLVLESVQAAARPSASIDGGVTWSSFPVLVPAADDSSGEDELVPALAEAYTHLRWTLEEPIAPGEAREVSFKVRIR